MNKDTAIKLLNMYLELNPHRHDLRTAIETVLEELKRQEQIKKDMRHVAYEEGYIQGFAQAKFDIEMDKINEGEV